jgi:hypothetical protein
MKKKIVNATAKDDIMEDITGIITGATLQLLKE